MSAKPKPTKVDDIEAHVAEALRRLRRETADVFSRWEADFAASVDVVRDRKASADVGYARPAQDAPADLGEPSRRAQVNVEAPERDALIGEVVQRLGGRQVWPKAKSPTTRLEVHEAIERGIPGKALGFMLEHVTEIPSPKLLNVIGISQRTVQRRAEAPDVLLSQDQGGRLWKFAEILTTATGLFGDQKSAERWLDSPAIALEQHAPVDLMTTQAGAELVEQLLTRLEHGVYT